MKSLFFFLVLFCLTGLAADQSTTHDEQKTFPKTSLRPIVGKYHSQEFLKQRFKKKGISRIAISFWSVSCMPCRREMSILKDWAAKTDSTAVIFINVDKSKRKQMAFSFSREFLKGQNSYFDFFKATASKIGVCQIEGCRLPNLFLVDQDFKVLWNLQKSSSETKLMQYLNLEKRPNSEK